MYERVIGLLRNKYTILQSTLPIKTIMCKDGEKSIWTKLLLFVVFYVTAANP